MGPYNGPSMGEVIIDNYEDSVMHFTKMSKDIFGGLFDEDPITLEKVMKRTGDENEGPTVVGTPRLCIFWFACDECSPMNVN
jgi:hypothetical protein